MRVIPITKEDLQCLLIRQALTVEEAARRLSRNPDYLKALCRRWGIVRPKKEGWITKEEMISLYVDQELSASQIAQKYNKATETIYWLNHHWDIKKQIKKDVGHHRKAARKYARKRRREFKIKAISHKGNKCQLCKIHYDGSNAIVFDFHHVDGEKEASISYMFANNAWEKIVKELDKCQLLCSNCHRKYHNGGW
jgi:transposase-like protein